MPYSETRRSQGCTAIERAGDVADVLDRLRHAPFGAAHADRQRFDAQAVDADDAEAIVQKMMRERIAGRAHAATSTFLPL